MKIFILVCSIALLGCGAAPVKIQQYLLNSPTERAIDKQPGLPLVLVKQVNIADYLRQANLVILVAPHQVYYSPQDIWAEPLQASFTQALLQELNKVSSLHFVGPHSPLAVQASRILNIDLTHFHSTALSTVVGSGDYWITTSSNQLEGNSDLAINEKGFYFELDLQQDGFAHAVNKLRTTVTLLAKQINQDIAALPNK